VRGLTHRYEPPEGTLVVLDAVTFSILPGGYVALTGASGAGKSTLLSILGGLEAPQSGQVQVGGRDLHGLGGDELAAYRRATVGFVFQHFGLLDTLTASENVEVALTLAGARAGLRRARAAELLEAVGLGGRAGHRPAALSGGERQRVAIARALVLDPAVLLADEPTGNLDSVTSRQIIGLLHDLHRAGETIVLVTHDIKIAATAERLLVMRDGELTEHEHDDLAEDVVEVIDRLLDTT
jgi:putative ABC transport system ATP-binding protein